MSARVPVPGRQRFTWCRRRQETGGYAVIIEHSTSLRYLTVIPYPIYKISAGCFKARQSSAKSILLKPTNRFQWNPKTFPRLQSQRHLYEFLRMPFGLRNAAQTFQRFVDQVLRGLSFCFAYLNDILVFSSTPDEHASHLQQLFTRLTSYGLVANAAKCEFGVKELDFLGHHVDACGIQRLPDKMTVIRNFPRPTTATKLQEFLGLVNFYRRFIPRCAHISQPLYDLLQNPKPKVTPLQ